MILLMIYVYHKSIYHECSKIDIAQYPSNKM